jgi:hypothetical protein
MKWRNVKIRVEKADKLHNIEQKEALEAYRATFKLIAVLDGGVFLYALVMALAHDFAVADEHRTDGNAALRAAQAGFVDGGLHEFVFGGLVGHGEGF